MSHVTHELTQGTPEWHAHRQRHFNASEIAAVLGISKYQTRTDILKSKAVGSERIIDTGTQRLFDDGHACEEAARPFAEEIIGEDLYKPTLSLMVDGLPLSASYDGITMGEEVIWEHKRANHELLASLHGKVIPDEYKPQLEQQLLICGAKKCLFMASDGTRENMIYAWYESDPKLRAIILSAWKQFAEDLANYVPIETPAPIVAKPVTDLPAVLVQVKGQIDIQDNFKLFETALKDFIENRLIREPKTDQDFADLELQVKALKKAEDALDSAESMMLAQVSAIDMAKRQKDMLHELARTNRLLAEKLVKSEKENRRLQIVKGGDIAWIDHVQQINKTFGGKITLPHIPSNFVGVVKGLKSISSMQNAVDTELARVKIEANRVADGIRINLASLRELSAGYEFLFTDAQQLVLKANDDLVNLIKSRVNEHKDQERQKEERIRAQAEADARAKIEREQAEEAERQRKAAEAKQPEPATPVAEVKPVAQQTTVTPASQRQSAPAAQVRARPSDAEFIQLVMNHYQVDKQTAIDWLMAFQFRAVG